MRNLFCLINRNDRIFPAPPKIIRIGNAERYRSLGSNRPGTSIVFSASVSSVIVESVELARVSFKKSFEGSPVSMPKKCVIICALVVSASDEFIIVKRPGTADEVAQAIVFLIQNDFVTGTTVDVDGGWLLS